MTNVLIPESGARKLGIGFEVLSPKSPMMKHENPVAAYSNLKEL
jgi:hypothetical protein